MVHEAPQHHRLPRVVPRSDDGVAVDDVEQDAAAEGFGPLVPGVYHTPYANCYRCPVGRKPESCGAECVDYLTDQLLVHLVSPDEVAAIVVEPIQGEGGYVVPPAVFIERLRS